MRAAAGESPSGLICHLYRRKSHLHLPQQCAPGTRGHCLGCHNTLSSQSPTARSHSMGLSDKTPTVLAQAETTPVSPELHTKEHSLAAFDK